jgi:hypothetical protein
MTAQLALRPDAGALADRGHDACRPVSLCRQRPVDARLLGAGHLVHLCGRWKPSCIWGFPNCSARVPSLVISHMLVAVLYVGFRLVIHVQKRKAER